MNNEELKQKVLEQIKALGISPRQYSALSKDDPLNIFPIGTRSIYQLARGQFKKCGKAGIAILEKHFRELENDKENG